MSDDETAAGNSDYKNVRPLKCGYGLSIYKIQKLNGTERRLMRTRTNTPNDMHRSIESWLESSILRAHCFDTAKPEEEKAND